MLLSNFLNNSFSTPPRWGMVGLEEIERIDIIYGPLAALYPGTPGGVIRRDHGRHGRPVPGTPIKA
jgi:iron complex outermembrane receptor protein